MTFPKIRLFLPVGLFFVLAASVQSGNAQIELAADSALKQMSATLSAAQSFSFTGVRTLDAGLLPVKTASGKKVAPFVSQVVGEVVRPNKFFFKVQGAEDTRQFYFDGNEFTLLDYQAKSYGSVMTTSVNIDQMLGHLQTRWGFMPPVSDFIMSDPYKMLTADVKTGRVVNTGGTNQTLHLSFTQATVDWDLWISQKTNLPEKLIIVFKQKKDSPKLQFDFKTWNLQAALPAKDFRFVPFPGVTEMYLTPLKKK